LSAGAARRHTPHVRHTVIEVPENVVELVADLGLNPNHFDLRPGCPLTHFDQLDDLCNGSMRQQLHRIKQALVRQDIDVADVVLVDDTH